MDIKRCAAFVAAVETESMSGAAKALGYTPSGIIRLINALEEEVGFPVLARSTTGVAPTPEGRKLLPMYRDIVRLAEQAEKTSVRIRGLAEGSLAIGVLSSVAAVWLPDVIVEFQHRFPGVQVHVVGGSDVSLLEQLEEHAVDCLVFHGDHSKLNWIPLGKQELTAWIPKGHPMARNNEVLLAEFDGQPFIRIHPEGETFAERLLRERNLEPDIRFTATDCYAAWNMVKAGLGTTLCCSGLAEGWKGDVEVRSLSPHQYLEFGIATLPHTATSPAVDEFIEVAKRYAGTWPA